MIKKFCDKCLDEVNCTYIEKEVTETIDNKNITYLKKYYQCQNCNQILYDDLLDYNIEVVNNELRKINQLITVDEIKQILKKYNIGKKPASLILGLGEITLTRYLNGQNPTKDNSDLLKMILNNSNLYEMYLITNKDKITELAYKKSLGVTKQLQLTSEHSKLYNVSLYIISKLDDPTPLVIQKLLYFSDGFSKKILNKRLFNDLPQAWIHGPVYNDIYDCFSYYKGNEINYSKLLKDYEFNLLDDEKKYLDVIISFFGCYSGNILKEMTHLTDPWISAREGLDNNMPSNRTIEESDIYNYFNYMCDKFGIECAEDIYKYSQSMFNEVLKKSGFITNQTII